MNDKETLGVLAIGGLMLGDNLKQRGDKAQLEKDVNSLSARCAQLEAEVADRNRRLNQAISEKDSVLEENNALKAEIAKIKKKNQ